MESVEKLNKDLQNLQKIFTIKNVRCQVLKATTAEFVLNFISPDNVSNKINAVFDQDYPKNPPLWFCDTDDVKIIQILELLANTKSDENLIVNQVIRLLCELCGQFNVDLPNGMDELFALQLQTPKVDNSFLKPTTSAVKTVAAAKKPPVNDMPPEQKLILDKLRAMSVEAGPRSSRPQISATDRLMKELADVYRSQSFRSKMYTVELINDSLLEWKIILKSVDPDSQLQKDLQVYREKNNGEGIELNILFNKAHPIEPPFVRIVKPVIHGGYVQSGGAICLELLTQKGWSSAYNVEAVIMQIITTLVRGRARIDFSNTTLRTYTLEMAKLSFANLLRVHKHGGWHSTPKTEG